MEIPYVNSGCSKPGLPRAEPGDTRSVDVRLAGCMHPPLHEAAQEHVTGHRGSKNPQVIPGSHASDNSWMATGHPEPKGGVSGEIQGR